MERSPNQLKVSAKTSSIFENSSLELKSSDRPSVSEEAMEIVRQSFVRSPRKSTRVAAYELGMPQETGGKIFRKKLNFKTYHLQLKQQITEVDY
ncbi:hypothetical protein TNCV_4045641 [Trichonephila clavipes]|nr:hypothetical protein TNCV_4045641 [Trichonephila clavipes]